MVNPRVGVVLMLALAAAVPALPAPALAETYVVDGEVSRFAIATSIRGMLKRMGHAPRFAVDGVTGYVDFAPERVTAARARLTIPLSGLRVTGPAELDDEDRAEIRARALEDVFVADRHPNAVLVVYGATLAPRAGVAPGSATASTPNSRTWTGSAAAELTLGGVTRPLTVPLTLRLDGAGLAARGAVVIRHSDFELKPYRGAAGMLKVEDPVTLRFVLLARPGAAAP